MTGEASSPNATASVRIEASESTQRMLDIDQVCPSRSPGTSAETPGMKRVAWSLIAWLALVYAASTLLYLLQPDHYEPLFRDKYLRRLPLVLFHGTLGVTALAVGVFQFRQGPGHRLWGYLYLGAVLFSGCAGLFMAQDAEGGGPARVGFSLMGALWLATAILAWIEARRGRLQKHRAWMVRNYALTLAAVTLRVYLQGMQWAGCEFTVIYPWLAWLCWAPNLLVAEWWLQRQVEPWR